MGRGMEGWVCALSNVQAGEMEHGGTLRPQNARFLGGTSLQKGNLEPLLGGAGPTLASIEGSGGGLVDRRPDMGHVCHCCGRLHPRRLYSPTTPASWEDQTCMSGWPLVETGI